MPAAITPPPAAEIDAAYRRALADFHANNAPPPSLAEVQDMYDRYRRRLAEWEAA
jgi:hypothetical protein